MSSKVEQARAYHERTKHRLDGYARGPRSLDWDLQPDPFRRFAGAPLVELPLLSRNADPPTGLTFASLSALLELALGLSAWKQFGPNRWALRCNPSSGNLHPTEGYLVATGIKGLDNGVYHYAPREHALEMRAGLVSEESSPLCLIGLTSIAWREAWKYGERAFRYVQLDAGHALGAFRYAAAALRLWVELLPLADAEIGTLLGLDRTADFAGAEAESPEMLLRIHAGQPARDTHLPKATGWRGKANALSSQPRDDWPVIEEVTTATTREAAPLRINAPSSAPDLTPRPALIPLIKQRRSAQTFSGQASVLPREDFHAILDAVLPRRERAPWDAWNLPVRTHLALFVHRVTGLPPGLYALPRECAAEARLRTAMDPEFEWQKPDGCPETLPLFRLLEGDARNAARTLSCHQDIASTSAFNLGMLAEFDTALTEGAHIYRHLFWEAGLIGQVLYLEAEAIGLRGTGIGCFFDDSVHELLGMRGTAFQSVYHFTLGSPVTDNRLETLPAYAHLPAERQPRG